MSFSDLVKVSPYVRPPPPFLTAHYTGVGWMFTMGLAAAPDTQAALPPLPGQGGQVLQVQVDGAQLHQQEGGAGQHLAHSKG